VELAKFGSDVAIFAARVYAATATMSRHSTAGAPHFTATKFTGEKMMRTSKSVGGSVVIKRHSLLMAAILGMSFVFAPAVDASIYLTPGGGVNLPKDGSTALNALEEVLTGNQTGQSDINTAIAVTLGSSTELYKHDFSPLVESGTFASSYSTLFSNPSNDPGNATISYVSGAKIVGATHVLVKDGNHEPAWYLYNITGLWDGMANIEAINFWPNGGAISHITLYGTTGPPTGTGPNVPEPAALLVWVGLILAGGSIAGDRRRG
jgi:hypothetical protein